MSRRTDGGPGQPIRVAPGGEYGEAKALREQQQAAPLASGGPPPQPGAGGRTPVQARPVNVNPFGPTQRPNEPITAGLPFGPGPTGRGLLPDDPMEFARAIYQTAPNEDLRRLLAWGGRA